MRAKWVKNKPKTTSVSPLDELETVSSQRVCRLLAAVGRWLLRLVDRLPGQCTVSKLDAFDVFQRETSRGKVAAILFLTPVPCLVVNLLLECIPLNDPTAGFLSSGHYQLRMFLTGFLSSLMPSLIKVDCVPQSPAEQFWVSFLLPFLKLTVQRVLWLLTRDDHDLIAVMTSCAGHLYHVLFIAMVLQHSKSLKTMGVVVLLGVGRMLFNCRYILSDAKNIRLAQAKIEGNMRNSFRQALTIAQEPQVAKELHKKTPSLLLSTYPGYRRDEFLARHTQMLQKATVFVNRGHSLASILPWNEIQKPTRQATAPVLKSPPKAWTNTADSIGTRTAFVTEVAVALHQSEMILLRAYMTIWMASFYVIYLVAVFWLPNHQYFATQSAMTTFEAVGNSVTRLLLLCGMEIFFLGGYFVLISRNLGVSGVYQLAFVLWSQRLLVLSNTIYLTIDIVGFPLAHTGNDIILPLK